MCTHSLQRAQSFLRSFSARQEIPHILRNPKRHYRFYNSLLPVHILSQINPVNAPNALPEYINPLNTKHRLLYL